MVDFYELRDSFHDRPYSPEDAREKLFRMAEIANDELKNTREALETVRAYPILSYSYAYHYGISVEMCEFKISHTEQLLKTELPLLYYSLMFNRNRHPELLHFEMDKYLNP